MAFGADQDPDLDEPSDAVLVLYTWSTIARDDPDTTTVDESAPVAVMVSTSPQPLQLDDDRNGANDYLDMKIMASVEYYEVDPVTGEIAKSDSFSAVTEDYIKAPEPGQGPPASVSFDFTTDADGLVVSVAVANVTPLPSEGVAVLQASQDGEGGWITSSREDVSLTGGANTNVTLAVDEDANGTDGDGGGLYYRVVFTFGTGQDEMSFTSDAMQLGDVADPDDQASTTDIISGATAAVGENIRVNTGGEDAEVQWQVSNTMGGYDDIDGATSLTLTVTNDHAGKTLRAKVTYTADDNPATTDVDEEGWPIWVEYTELLPVSGDVTNNAPASTQDAYEIRVELAATKTVPGEGEDADPVVLQPAAIVEASIADLFFDSDGDDLTYTITAVDPDLANVADDADGAGYDAMTAAGDQVYSSYTTVTDTGTDVETSRDLQQTFAVDDDGGVTYFTDRSGAHDGDTTDDGAGNMVVFTVTANDGMTEVGDRPSVPVTVRINVAPSAIELDDTNGATPANLPAPARGVTGTALTTDGTALVTYMDDEDNGAAAKVADLDIMDQNATDDDFGTHKVVLTGRGANMFEVRETDDDDEDGSTWEIWLKDDATFDFEALKNARTEATATSITLSITVTATDGGGRSTQGVFSVVLMDADTDDDPVAPTPRPRPDAPDPEVPGLEDDADDGDDDGPVIPPDDGGAWIGDGFGDDLLDQFVISIDDIDVA